MKILILANNSVGLYNFRKELLQRLIELGNEVYISLPYGEKIELLKEFGCQFIDTPVDRRGLNPVKDLGLLKEYLNLIKRVKPEMVITYTIKPNIYGGLTCQILKIPYAANITGLGTAFQKQGALRRLVTMMYKISIKKAKVVFFENVENQQIFINDGIVRKSNTCLLSGAGVNLEHFHYAEYPEQNEPVRFLFIGRIMKEKGIDELFKAMERLYEDKIHCALDVLGGYEENYIDKIQKYESEGWLKYHGKQPDVRPYIEKAHCFVLPSWHEGMANTNLECASMGRPLITSDIHGCKEAVVENISGFLCERKNADSLYEAMKRFIGLSNSERKVMGISGRKHMEEVFDKNKVVKNTVEKLLE